MPLKTNRIFCIGRNYAEHAEELNNQVPSDIFVFMKAPQCLISETSTSIKYPPHGKELQQEVELVVRMANQTEISHIALGLDLTLRDIQAQLKNAGLSWEKAKSFEQSASCTEFYPYDKSIDLQNIELKCYVNDQLKQNSNSANMIHSVQKIINHLNEIWILEEGDLIFTGTPAGVSCIKPGDNVKLENALIGTKTWTVVE